ncbi:hypothetical protein [Streptomyces tubercidicus]|uniref:hypothetical protein n=1 Tax=Streptomyces tubercidicus TaxID=47759 RepID=UPI002E107733|nr:hypothetical protein OG761_08620 [Streptomyces tubercidicus]
MNNGPELPTLRRGFTVVTRPDYMIVDTGTRRHRFAGKGVPDVLTRLLPLLDGSRDRAALAADSGVAPAAVHTIVSALDARGMLEPEPPGEADGPVAMYLSRTGPVAAPSEGPAAALRRLAGSTVLLSGPDELTAGIREDLERCGVGRVVVAGPDGVFPDDMAAGTASLMLAFDGLTEDAALHDAVAAGAAQGIDVLRFALADDLEAGGTVVETGPRFRDGATACVSCFRTGYGKAFPAAAPARPDGLLTEGAGRILAGLVAAEATAVLAGAGRPGDRRSLRRVSVPKVSAPVYLVAPEPGCEACGISGQEPARDLDTLEWLSRDGPPERVGEAASYPDPPTPPVELPSSPRSPLPDSGPPAEGRWDERAIGHLFARSAGPRSLDDAGWQGRRWAASGGNRGSVQLYLLTERHPCQLPGTVFKYQGETGSLLSVGVDDVPLSQLLAGTGIDHGGLVHAVVFVGAVERLRNKYREFSYRLTHLDTGCALAQYTLLARAHQLAVGPPVYATGKLNARLGLDSRRAVAVTAVGLYERSDGDADRR